MLNKKLNQIEDGIFIVQSDKTNRKFRFTKPWTKSTLFHNTLVNKHKKHPITILNGTTAITTKKNHDNNECKSSDTNTSVSLTSQENVVLNSCINNADKIFTEGNQTEHEVTPVFKELQNGTHHSHNASNTVKSLTDNLYKSQESFQANINQKLHRFFFINPQEGLTGFNKPLRLFNKNGKPLTDRMGRPLIDILGQPLVVLDEKGLLKSDSKGNQVFNTLGESAIYSNTNLFISPSDDEPGIPLLDIDKKHIIYLYDNKGHPLTDGLGRPLVNASGRPMFGLKSCEKINVNNFKHYQLKNLYSKAPLENFVRRVQIFNSHLKPLTDEAGITLKGAKIICNKDGMPMCDASGNSLMYKYGIRIFNPDEKGLNNYASNDDGIKYIPSSLSSEGFSEKLLVKEKNKLQPTLTEMRSCMCEHVFSKEDSENVLNVDCLEYLKNVEIKEKKNKENIKNGYLSTLEESDEMYLDVFKSDASDQVNYSVIRDKLLQTNEQIGINKNSKSRKTIAVGSRNLALTPINPNENKITHIKEYTQQKKNSTDAIILFDASKKMVNHKSSINTVLFGHNNRMSFCQHYIKKKPKTKIYSSNFIEYFKNALNITKMRQNDKRPTYNDYGKPLKDFYGNLIYDKFGMPLTGAHGIELNEKVRNKMRVKLRNIPVLPISNKREDPERFENKFTNDLPFYDKYGRPLYDLFGTPNYDVQGRPLADAFGRPLINVMGKHLIDSEENVLCFQSKDSENSTLVDIFGRRLYERRGRPLFDSYGRPRYDIFTNAIYDSCGRPATDANGNILYDFLNKPIQPHPEKPLYKNARALLPKYIDKILAMPCMHRVFKYSKTTLKDAFGGPIFDDSGRPLYNKLGKPLYDKYGRSLFDKEGIPLCDCYGRPLSEEIRGNTDDQTLSVIDSLKLLKLTEASSKWMEIKQSEAQNLKSTKSEAVDNAIFMNVVQPAKYKSTKYIYALTRVTKFASGRHVVEILEAPLSQSTASEIHHLPLDNKPLMMVERQRHRRVVLVKKPRTIKTH